MNGCMLYLYTLRRFDSGWCFRLGASDTIFYAKCYPLCYQCAKKIRRNKTLGVKNNGGRTLVGASSGQNNGGQDRKLVLIQLDVFV